MELWDIYDEFRNPKGYVHERGKHIERGDYHLVVHVWIVNDKGEYLIQRRQPWKHGWPNMWDCAAGGSALIKENTKEASIREVKEEIGVDLDEKNMEKLLEILNDIQPDADYETCTTLIDDEVLDSFAILSIVGELEEAFDIEITPVDIVPENFNSAQALWAMVQRLQEA